MNSVIGLFNSKYITSLDEETSFIGDSNDQNNSIYIHNNLICNFNKINNTLAFLINHFDDSYISESFFFDDEDKNTLNQFLAARAIINKFFSLHFNTDPVSYFIKFKLVDNVFIKSFVIAANTLNVKGEISFDTNNHNVEDLNELIRKFYSGFDITDLSTYKDYSSLFEIQKY